MIFVCGMAASAALIYNYVDIPEARAGEYSCIRSTLNAHITNGNIPAETFTITYKIPACLKNEGYVVKEANLDSGLVAVTYFKTSN